MQSQWKPEIFANFEEIRVRERILKEKEEELMKAVISLSLSIFYLFFFFPEMLRK